MTDKESTNFIKQIIDADMESGKYAGRVHTRFPPEPNGYLHIGHAKSIILNFGLAEEYGGKYNLRYDDTNPTKEEVEYVESIQADIRWLGFDWEERLFYASDYFEQLYDFAVQLIKVGKAYVDDLSQEEMRTYRGSLTEAGKNSPHRDRPVEENLDLFARMRAGEFPEGERVLRAKIDMASPNLNLRDPVLYRILHAEHHRTGDTWCVYPMYDFAHGYSDSMEHITHSICTLEFEDHRPLYNWFIESLGLYHPQQIEFARLNLTHTVMSKRKLLRLVDEGYVSGWDDPRMPTLSGLRRRGYTPVTIRAFMNTIGVAKANSMVEIQLLEHTLRQDLEQHARRVMAVLDPVKLVINNFPEDQVLELELDYFRHDQEREELRVVPFSREVYIEREDFMEEPPSKYFRMSPGREVRLMNACLVTCTGVVKDDAGNIVEVHADYDPESIGGATPDGRRVKGTLHWVSAPHAIPVEARLYDHLFTEAYPEETPEGQDFTVNLNPESLKVVTAYVEPAVEKAQPGDRFQFMRKGYFIIDPVDSSPQHLIFNQTVALRDSWKKKMKK